MSSNQATGEHKQHSYIGTPSDLKQMLTVLESELRDAKMAYIQENTKYAEAKLARCEERAAQHPDWENISSEVEEARQEVVEARAIASERVLPVTRYEVKKMLVSTSSDIASLPFNEIFPNKADVSFDLGGSLYRPEIRVRVSRRSGVSVSASADSLDWTEKVLGIAQREMEKGRPWWAWVKHPAMRIASWLLYAPAALLAIWAKAPLSTVALAVMLLVLIPMNSGFILVGSSVREPGRAKGQRSLLLRSGLER